MFLCLFSEEIQLAKLRRIVEVGAMDSGGGAKSG